MTPPKMAVLGSSDRCEIERSSFSQEHIPHLLGQGTWDESLVSPLHDYALGDLDFEAVFAGKNSACYDTGEAAMSENSVPVSLSPFDAIKAV